jgi:hypothetical protein
MADEEENLGIPSILPLPMAGARSKMHEVQVSGSAPLKTHRNYCSCAAALQSQA